MFMTPFLLLPPYFLKFVTNSNRTFRCFAMLRRLAKYKKKIHGQIKRKGKEKKSQASKEASKRKATTPKLKGQVSKSQQAKLKEPDPKPQDNIRKTKTSIGRIGFGDNPHAGPLLEVRGITPRLTSPLHLGDQPLKVDLGLDGGAVGDGGPAPDVPALGVGAGCQQCPQDEQVPVAAGEVQGGVALQVGVLDSLGSAPGSVGEQDLQDGVVPAQACLHDGVTATGVAAGDGGGTLLAEEEDHLGVAGGGGEHQGGLVVVVQGGAGVLVPAGDEELANEDMAEGCGSVEVGIGEAGDGEVGVVEEVGVRFENTFD